MADRHVVIVHQAEQENNSGVEIVVAKEFPPRGHDWQNTNLETFRVDAKLIADALFAHLPGGTIDHLLLEFLRRKASQFVVAFDTIEKTPKLAILEGIACVVCGEANPERFNGRCNNVPASLHRLLPKTAREAGFTSGQQKRY